MRQFTIWENTISMGFEILETQPVKGLISEVTRAAHTQLSLELNKYTHATSVNNLTHSSVTVVPHRVAI